ncbi:MAG: HlyD family type I secretion periplasmic adaptor subunit [Gemmatimonadetes bacterium]|nr:HlyD family type I secretion periplasmic adaptor subunit [Gemmatimonadota bacterium]MYD59943.1 HlyD family type I secretion periplasmic adaptor subunit [Gemmatimonadota bacterium]
MAEAQVENPTENETDLAESTIEFLGSLHPFFSRALIYVLLLFIAISIAWAWYGQVDIVATAPFRLVPLGKVQNIQAPRSGEIQEIAIHSGDLIAEGQILFRLRSQETLKEFRELEQAEIAFKKAEFDLQQTLPQKRILAKETISALEHRVRVMQTAMQTYREALGNHTQKQNTTSHPPDIEIEIHTAEVEHLKQQYEQNQKLYEKRLISLAARDEAKVRYLSALAELPARMAEINRYEVSLKDLKRQILEERLELERTRANFQNAYDIAEIRLKQAKQTVNRSVDADIDLILAPEPGIITQVLVNTPGQVVNKGQTLVTIAPASTPIVAEALILNKDVGLLSSGQKVKLKFEAFPFQDYGIQHGYLRQISPDAMGDEGSGTVFRGIIDLDNKTIFVHGEEKAFMFGMKGTAEIITDRQSILMLALNPLRQLREIAALSPEAQE